MKVPDELWINLGKEFKVLNSSRFCQDLILKLKHKADELLDLPQTKFQFINDWDGHKIIKFIYSKITKLKVGENFLLSEFSLLTQLNVGLLYLLGNTFQYVKLKIDQRYGYVVSLENFTADQKIINFFKEIIIASEKSHENSSIVLTILPMELLYSKCYNNCNPNYLVLY